MFPKTMNYYAHSQKDKPTEYWQTLDDHLNNVACMAAGFAENFGGQQWAEIAGKFHDLGKGTRAWQAWIRKANGIVDDFSDYFDGHPNHADAGAQVLNQKSKMGMLLAYAIAGHHAGMPDWFGEADGTGLDARLKATMPGVSVSVPEPDFPRKPPFNMDNERMGYQLQFFIRMLFSCLVDADWLDTEKFMDAEKASTRGGFLPLESLYNRFWEKFSDFRQKADKESAVNRQREKCLTDCLEAAILKPGLFSLTVPTGGGKTLASMAFALEHAKQHGKNRIIYVIPFTSIIEQNARKFREYLGDDAILEHHCNYIADRKDIPDDTASRIHLATENWDAPVVVTTNVQFFDSLYANKPSRCRKLHNLADSIIIFDEVQAIPVEKLKPCIEAIKELAENYGTSCLLCTATQPAIGYSENFQSGLKNVREIIKDVPSLFDSLKRTEETYIGELDEESVATKLMDWPQILCIVNTRKQALNIYNGLPESDDNFHLSALMYPQHRTRTLNNIRDRLTKGLPCRVVSTQLIEAGVDVDFPCVYRALSGIDSIAQAAGRCNREGRNPSPQPVHVFQLPGNAGPSVFRQAAQSAEKLLEEYDGRLTCPDCVQAYFDDYFWKNEENMDKDQIISKLTGRTQPAVRGYIQFKEIGKFRMIESDMIPIIVAFGEASKLADKLTYTEHKGSLLRKLQQYTVQIYSHQFKEIASWLEEVDGIFILRNKELYSMETGLACGAPHGEGFFI